MTEERGQRAEGRNPSDRSLGFASSICHLRYPCLASDTAARSGSINRRQSANIPSTEAPYRSRCRHHRRRHHRCHLRLPVRRRGRARRPCRIQAGGPRQHSREHRAADAGTDCDFARPRRAFRTRRRHARSGSRSARATRDVPNTIRALKCNADLSRVRLRVLHARSRQSEEASEGIRCAQSGRAARTLVVRGGAVSNDRHQGASRDRHLGKRASQPASRMPGISGRGRPARRACFRALPGAQREDVTPPASTCGPRAARSPQRASSLRQATPRPSFAGSVGRFRMKDTYVIATRRLRRQGATGA